MMPSSRPLTPSSRPLTPSMLPVMARVSRVVIWVMPPSMIVLKMRGSAQVWGSAVMLVSLPL